MSQREHLGPADGDDIAVCPRCGAKAWSTCLVCGWRHWSPPDDPDELRTDELRTDEQCHDYLRLLESYLGLRR